MARGAEARVPTLCPRARWRVPQFPARQPLAPRGGWQARGGKQLGGLPASRLTGSVARRMAAAVVLHTSFSAPRSL
jgi:hypothetical protein